MVSMWLDFSKGIDKFINYRIWLVLIPVFGRNQANIHLSDVPKFAVSLT